MFHFPSITSRDNQKLKFARAVRDGRSGASVFVEGIRLAEEVLRTRLSIQFGFFTAKLSDHSRGLTLLESLKNLELFELDEHLFGSIADTTNSQGIVLIAEKPTGGRAAIEQNLSTNPLILLLHKINNPTNLGSVLRTAEAVGVEGIITTQGTADVFSSKTTRGAMGANLRLPIWTNADFSEAIGWAKSRGVKTVCADVRSRKSYLEIDWNVPRMLVVGSEGHGLTEAERAQTDDSLIIPMQNGVESLNVAVASGVILFYAKHSREMF